MFMHRLAHQFELIIIITATAIIINNYYLFLLFPLVFKY